MEIKISRRSKLTIFYIRSKSEAIDNFLSPSVLDRSFLSFFGSCSFVIGGSGKRMWLAIRSSFGSSYRLHINLPRGFWMTSHNNKVVFEDYLLLEAKLQFRTNKIQGFIFHSHFTSFLEEKQSWLNRNGWENFCQFSLSLAFEIWPKSFFVGQSRVPNKGM